MSYELFGNLKGGHDAEIKLRHCLDNSPSLMKVGENVFLFKDPDINEVRDYDASIQFVDGGVVVEVLIKTKAIYKILQHCFSAIDCEFLDETDESVLLNDFFKKFSE